MFLLDKDMFTGILRVTTIILQDYFYYSNECLAKFFDEFVEVIADDYVQFYSNATDKLKHELKYHPLKRKYFTSYFVSYHLHEVLAAKLHFTEMELQAFENLIPKYTGVHKHDKQINKRAYH